MRAAKFIAGCLGCLAFASAAIGAGGAPNFAPTQRNVVYGSDRAERCDVYAPHGVAHAPVVFFVHGGGWAHGDKASPGRLHTRRRVPPNTAPIGGGSSSWATPPGPTWSH